MFRAVILAFLCVFAVEMLSSKSATAQTTNAQSGKKWWVQLEAHSDLRTAQTRARSYGQAFPNINGFRLRSGWYALAAGPFSRTEASDRLRELKYAGIIPKDSFLAAGRDFDTQFWPVGGSIAPNVTTAELPPTPPASTPVAPTPAMLVISPPEETVREARQGESLLNHDDRKALQIAMEWFGFYHGGIDGSFGKGTRRAMAAWQEAESYKPTGVLTTHQRAVLFKDYHDALRRLGIAITKDDKAGIEIAIPANLVAFDKYEAPFAQYNSKHDSGVRVLLISQQGNQDTLSGLFDVMQTLAIVPPGGEQDKRNTFFVLTGRNEVLQSYTYARLDGDQIKGFTLVYPAQSSHEMAKTVKIMRDSLVSLPGVMSPYEGNPEEQAYDLLAGLEIRRPTMSRSGVFISSRGQVLTSADAVRGCTRITLDGEQDAELTAIDGNLALLTPVTDLAPIDVARFAQTVGRLRSNVVASGYSYGGALGAPTLSYGTLEDIRGLKAEPDVQRLAISVEPGDAGGPVLDAFGSVSGLMLPRPGANGRTLPQDVSFAANVEAIAAFLIANGVDVDTNDETAPLAAEDLAAVASEITSLVGCWN